jgi:intracellular multiplication protein IcmJ
MYPLALSVTPGAWRIFAKRKADPAFLKFAEKIFKRDNYTCQFCGFQAQDYQEIINLDRNYSNNKTTNLVTACCFCAQCFFLESVSVGRYGGGTLVYLPEIDQANVNSFCHVLFCAVANDTGYKNSAQAIYRNLKFRAQLIEDEFGEGCSNPAVYGELYLDVVGNDTSVLERMLKNVRLLPSRGGFKTQVDHWAATALKELATEI